MRVAERRGAGPRGPWPPRHYLSAVPALATTSQIAAAPAAPPAADDWPTYRGSWSGLLVRLAARALLDPRLAVDLLRTAWAFRRLRWYARAPFLPLPDGDYLRWRMYTAYGDEAAVPPIDDLIRFVRWRREVMHL